MSEQHAEKQPTGFIINNLSNADYHADRDSYSSTLVKAMEVPAKARHMMLNPQNTNDTFMLGSAIHKWILERDRFCDEFLTGITAARRSKADKQAWAAWFSEHGANGEAIIELPAAQWNGEFEAQTGKSLVTPESLQQIIDMAESVALNPNAMELLSGGQAEQSVYWTDDETGLPLRCRPDYLNDNFISDLKSCQSVSDRALTRAIADYGYGISQAMYQDGVYQVTGVWRPFTFIFIEKTAPYLCRVIALDEDAQYASHAKYRQLLARLKHCLDTDTWPGIDDNLSFAMPDWFIN